MSLAHILSLSRVVAAPIIAVLILARPETSLVTAALLFALASITDLLDGKLARYSESVSPLGIFLDTTADKVLVALTLIALSIAGLAPAWVTLVIIGREFLISGLRSFAASQERIISAHTWGKGKTLVTMIAIFCLLVTAGGRAGGVIGPVASHVSWSNLVTVSTWLLYLSAALTVVSGVRYVIDARPLFRPEAPVEVVASGKRRSVASGRDG